MVAPDLIDPFHRQLYNKLDQEIQERVIALSEGSALKITDDRQSVTEKYAAQVSYIKALRDVLEICKELEQDRYGSRPRQAEDD
jgi:hypothetical protein